MWTSFIDAVEEELIDAFLIARDVAGAFRGRSQGQKVGLACLQKPLVRQVSTWQP